eukprot:scaffold101258_cov67-Phaeocystis_antarctica.AAC.1
MSPPGLHRAPALRSGAPGAMLPPVWCASHVVGENRLRRLGTAPGSLWKVAVLAVRFLRRG